MQPYCTVKSAHCTVCSEQFTLEQTGEDWFLSLNSALDGCSTRLAARDGRLDLVTFYGSRIIQCFRGSVQCAVAKCTMLKCKVVKYTSLRSVQC